MLVPLTFQTHLRQGWGIPTPLCWCYWRCTIAVLLEAVHASGCIFGCGRNNSLRCLLWCWLPSLSFAGPSPALSARSLVSITSHMEDTWLSLSEARRVTLSLGRDKSEMLIPGRGEHLIFVCCETAETGRQP